MGAGVSAWASINREADRIAGLPPEKARAAIASRLRRTGELEDGQLEVALDFNARLVTALRERGLPLWERSARRVKT